MRSTEPIEYTHKPSLREAPGAPGWHYCKVSLSLQTLLVSCLITFHCFTHRLENMSKN